MPAASRHAAAVSSATLRAWLTDGAEIALLDVREEGQHGAGHPLLAVNLPYSRLEIDVATLVPRPAVRCVLLDDGDGVAERAARRLHDLGYRNLHVLQGGAPGWQADGHALFESTNVPSKAFAEIIEHTNGTPHLEAAELHALQPPLSTGCLFSRRSMAVPQSIDWLSTFSPTDWNIA